MSQNQSIELLLEKYEQGTCTPEELAALEDWYHSLRGDGLPSNADEISMQQLKNHSWAHIASVIKEEAAHKKSRRPFFYLARAAAAAIIGVLFFFGYQFYISKSRVEFVTIKTAKGEFIKATLPDQSQVWVSGGSSLKYPKQFNKARDIFLEEGEAYFEVKHNEALPFIVHTTAGISTKVLGTKFSVKSFASLADAWVKVVSGKVQVQDATHTFGILTRNQEIRIDKISKTYAIATMDSSQMAGWNQGKISLNDVSFEELALSLENSFKIPVRISSKNLVHCRVSISYRLNDAIENILADISLIYKINIKRNEKGIMISGKGCLEKS